MAVVLRLQRTGKPHQPYFRVVAVEKRRGPRGPALEILGVYNPRGSKIKEKLQIHAERVDYWLGVGAKPSATVGSLIKAYRKPQ